MSFADNEGVRIHYQTEGQGPPLVLQHWSVATLENWYDFGYVSALKNDYRLILLDARGHGGSDKPQTSDSYLLEKRVGDIVAVLDDLSIAKTHFFGYSMGGWIGFGLAQYAPNRVRTLIIGGADPYATSMDGLRQFIRVGIEKGPEEFITMWEKEFGVLPLALRERMLNYDYKTLLLLSRDRESQEAVLPTMKMPCLLFSGEMDDPQRIQEYARQITNATFFSLPDLDHGGAIKRSDLVLPHVKRFLAGLDGEKDPL
jgi:pimeloyl-ACP methyl ester carboxylesterase